MYFDVNLSCGQANLNKFGLVKWRVCLFSAFFNGVFGFFQQFCWPFLAFFCWRFEAVDDDNETQLTNKTNFITSDSWWSRFTFCSFFHIVNQHNLDQWLQLELP